MHGRPLIAAVVVALTVTACDHSSSTELPNVGATIQPDGTLIRPRAPDNPESARHLMIPIEVTETGARMSRDPALEAGWVPGYPGFGTQMQLLAYDGSRKLIYELELPDPLTIRTYGTSANEPHGVITLQRADVSIAVPLLPGLTYLVIARRDRVTQVANLKAGIAQQCEVDRGAACKAWSHAAGR